jgi:hypothetical protein
MRHALRKPTRQHATATPRPASPVAQGGPVAALQQSIQERIGSIDLALALLPTPRAQVAERLIDTISRAAGPIVLGLAYGVTAFAFLG